MTKDLRKAVEADEGASQLLHSLRDLIQNARQIRSYVYRRCKQLLVFEQLFDLPGCDLAITRSSITAAMGSPISTRKKYCRRDN
jgi:hypothetical protein